MRSVNRSGNHSINQSINHSIRQAKKLSTYIPLDTAHHLIIVLILILIIIIVNARSTASLTQKPPERRLMYGDVDVNVQLLDHPGLGLSHGDLLVMMTGEDDQQYPLYM